MPSSEEIVNFLRSQNAIKEGESPWPSVGTEDRTFRIDWDKIFPKGYPEHGDRDWEIYEDNWQPNLPDWLTVDIGGAIGRPPQTLDSLLNGVNNRGLGEWDTCAWYQPMHFFGLNWGIFIRQDCIFNTMIRVAGFLPSHMTLDKHLINALCRGSFAIYFLHEQFHHKMESLGIRLHVVERRSVYHPYKNMVYRKTLGTDDNLEEALANADAFIRLETNPYRRWIGSTVLSAIQNYLHWRFKVDPPGYRKAELYLDNDFFQQGTYNIQAQLHEATLNPIQNAAEWAYATRLMQSMFKVSDNIWEVVSSRSPRPITGI